VDAAVRRTQVVTTYGVGAMIATREESVMVAGLDFWPVGVPDLNEPRLERRLGVNGFVQPPAGDGAASLPVVRFPLMHHCPECDALGRYWELADGGSTTCRICAVGLVPSRFVVACESGHIDDFPYMQWLHQGATWQPSCRMKLTTKGVSAALRDVIVSCSCGVPSRSLDGAFNAGELARVTSCQGRRPWLKDQEDCGKSLRTLQRGASNVWFAQVRSALAIPPWSDAAFNAINRLWAVLRHVHDPAQLRNMLEGMGGEPVLGSPVDEIVHAVLARRDEESGGSVESEAEFRRHEHDAIRVGRAETGSDDQFVARATPVAEVLRPVIDDVVLVDRLREVRVLQGFSRLLPPGSDAPDDRVAPISRSEPSWLPAIEVRGEGLFVSLAPEPLATWEAREDVIERVAVLRSRHVAYELAGDDDKSFVTPRFVLLHTFAHALIDAFSLDAGYPAAGLRERLYVADDMAGLLIYTATSDSAGSLGGVVAQGAPGRFERVVGDAVRRHAWCSADPVCIEADAQGVGGMNRAACHSCVLLPETSCEHRNVLLDRGLLVGTPSRPELGFFRELVVDDG
jgi:hypothetical protein